MDIWIIRHGPAQPRAELASTQPDAARALTKAGAERVRGVARGLERLDVRFDRLSFSPWRRAVETAELLAGLVDGEMTVTSLLRQAPGPALLSDLHAPTEALVGHEPWLGELAGLLAFADPVRGESLHIGKAAAIHLRGTPRLGCMHLLGLYPAKTLVRIGDS